MKEKPTLFSKEEEVLTKAVHALEQFKDQDTPLKKEYERLLKDYKKLFRQTKLLIKMSDLQQNQLTNQTEGLRFNNIELQTKAEKAEEAVRASEKKLAQFLEAVSVGVFVVDTNGKPYYANQKAQLVFGKGIVQSTTAEELPLFCQAYIAGTTQLYPQERQPIVQALKGKISSVDDIEIHQDDQILPIEVWGTPIFDEQGNIAYAIAVFQDITERKKAESERERFTTELFQLNKAYERFVPRQFLSLLDKKNITDVRLGDQVEKKMSILFADIRGFTSLSERMTPKDNFAFINAYLSYLEPVIEEHYGFIDKYIGDAIMALFPTNADDAVQAGITMQKRLAEYNQTRGSSDRPVIKIGIGIHTGMLMLGTVGCQNRMDGTVISDAVNLASRIEDLTKIYGSILLITEKTYSDLAYPSQYAIRSIDRVKVKGKSMPVTVYEVFDGDPINVIELKKQSLMYLKHGLAHYRQKNFGHATLCFRQMLHIYADDKAAQIYLRRCEQFLKHGVPDNWESAEMLERVCLADE